MTSISLQNINHFACFILADLINFQVSTPTPVTVAYKQTKTGL